MAAPPWLAAVRRHRRTSLLVIALSAAACSSGSLMRAPGDLPPYAGEYTRLFDNSLSLRLANPAVARDGERLLQARVAEADHIILGRLQTINERTRGNHSRFLLVFAQERSLAGHPLEQGTVTVEVGPETPSHGMIRAHRLTLAGTSAVLFLKWFQQDSEPRLHARVEPDDPAIHDAVTFARF